ncbi:MAG: hypothetical protein ABW019_03610 [Chitinophagaceae bacterium]
MQTKPTPLLLHPALLAGLAALLWNDLYLKYALHNWFTGKLSDFTGLFVFAVFGRVLWPGHQKVVIIGCALFFCWWKSPLSEDAIRLINDRLHLSVTRVVDYYDWLALPVLLPAYRLQPMKYPATRWRQAAVLLSGTVCLFAFCATSMPRHLQSTDTYISKKVRTPLKRKDIREKFAEKHIPLQKDSFYYQPLYDQDIYVKMKGRTGNDSLQPLSNFTRGELYYKRTLYDSAYTIPWLPIGTDTLKNIRFSMDETGNGKKRVIHLKSFKYDTLLPDGQSPYKWLQKKYRRPLVDKIKEVLE